MKILLVEDDPDVQAPILERLRSEGFEVDACADGQTAIDLGLENDYHAVLLDPGLPIFSGEQVIKRWRGAGRTFPIIVVTATRTMSDQVRELIRLGANQYIGKPIIDYDILVEWVRSFSNARGGVAGGAIVAHGDIEVDTTTFTVRLRGKRVSPGLSNDEFAILRELVLAAGHPLTPVELASRALDEREGPKDALVATYVQRIRRKLGNAAITTAGGGRGYAAG
ncbi:hypothetical protein IP88_14350 [alpha proteobacterium AAP81b]|nr:hypothetical protein IP88_14350 [alpha proteobacterium AAP81b]